MQNEFDGFSDEQLGREMDRVLPLCMMEGSDWDCVRDYHKSLTAEITRRAFADLSQNKLTSLLNAFVAVAA